MGFSRFVGRAVFHEQVPGGPFRDPHPCPPRRVLGGKGVCKQNLEEVAVLHYRTLSLLVKEQPQIAQNPRM